jgi:hypothetical protein
MKRRFAGIATTALAAALLAAPGAQATTVTVGSPLTLNFSPTSFGDVASIINTTLGEPGTMTAAPANGTITSWQVLDAIGGPLKLRVVHQPSSGLYTGAGSTTSGPITGTGVLTFTANLPINKGDLIGIDPTAGSDTIGGDFAGGSGSAFVAFPSPLTDGGPGRSPNSSGEGEASFNAQVLLNCIVPKLKGKKIGTARQALAAAGCAAPTIKKKGTKVIKKQNPAAGTEIPGNQSVVLKTKPKHKR